MDDLLKIVGYHLKKYPEMQSQDIVKLVYQNQFGGGDYYTDPDNAVDSIKCELEHVPFNKDASHDPIGNGLVRYNLCALPHNDQMIKKLVECMVATKGLIKGNKENYIFNLEFLESKLSGSDYEEFVTEYINDGCPYIHHSYIYDDAYNPTYRIISEKFLDELK